MTSTSTTASSATTARPVSAGYWSRPVSSTRSGPNGGRRPTSTASQDRPEPNRIASPASAAAPSTPAGSRRCAAEPRRRRAPPVRTRPADRRRGRHGLQRLGGGDRLQHRAGLVAGLGLLVGRDRVGHHPGPACT